MYENLEEMAQEAKTIVDKIIVGLEGYTLLSYGYSPEVFRNSALGLPEPKKAYAQIMIPGYILSLNLKNEEKDGKLETKIYHTNYNGSIIIENTKRLSNI